jgi:type II secretory pathway pseudopilin PulG
MSIPQRLSTAGAVALFVCLWVAIVAAQDTTAGDLGTAQNQTVMIVTSIIGFLSLLATQLFSIYRDREQRKRDLQDRAEAREAARQEARETANLLRREQLATATTLAQVNKKNTERVVAEVSRNTEITEAVGAKADKAYSAANEFTTRLEAMRNELYATGTQVDTIKETTDETKDIVTDIKEGKP